MAASLPAGNQQAPSYSVIGGEKSPSRRQTPASFPVHCRRCAVCPASKALLDTFGLADYDAPAEADALMNGPQTAIA